MSGQLQLPTEKLTWTINDYAKLHNNKELVINAEYQRSEVWKPAKKNCS
jgi:hypothetical protein